MKAKSIRGSSTGEIRTALQQSVADGFKPTLAFVFLTDAAEIDAITSLLNMADISIFGASTSQKFSEQGLINATNSNNNTGG